MNEARRLNHLNKTTRRIAIAIGWSSALVITFATLAPIGSRPHLPDVGPDIERFLAFLVLAGALATAYPRHRIMVLVLTVGLAIGLESAQLMQPSRHGRPHDAVIKCLGALAGVVLAIVRDKVFARPARAPLS